MALDYFHLVEKGFLQLDLNLSTSRIMKRFGYLDGMFLLTSLCVHFLPFATAFNVSNNEEKICQFKVEKITYRSHHEYKVYLLTYLLFEFVLRCSNASEMGNSAVRGLNLVLPEFHSPFFPLL